MAAVAAELLGALGTQKLGSHLRSPCITMKFVPTARSTGPVKWFLQYANEQLVHPQHTVPSAVPKVLRLPQRVPEDIDNVALAIQHFASC